MAVAEAVAVVGRGCCGHKRMGKKQIGHGGGGEKPAAVYVRRSGGRRAEGRGA